MSSRDFIYVDDIVQGLLACAFQGKPGEAYNLASGVETSIKDLAIKINDLTGNSAGVELRPRRTWDRSGHRFGSTQKAERELGFIAQINLDDGLQRAIEWTRQNLELIHSTIGKHAPLMEVGGFTLGRNS